MRLGARPRAADGPRRLPDQKRMTSGLQEKNWAVLSERGCEATHLSHEEARRLVHKLASEGCHGLCIVTNEAADRAGNTANKIDLVTAGGRV